MKSFKVDPKIHRQVLDMIRLETAHHSTILELSKAAADAKDAAWNLIKKTHPDFDYSDATLNVPQMIVTINERKK